MKPFVVLATLMLFGSCATPATPVVEPFTTPDGKKASIAYCGGDELRMTDCHAAARNSCGGNYSVIESVEMPREISNGPYTYPTVSRRIVFACSATG